MKKVLYLATLLFCAAFTSCEKEEIGGTATESIAGDWYVTVNPVDEDGNEIPEYEDLFGLGRIHVLTYNTSGNTSDQLYVDDLGEFWEFKVKATSDINAMTFNTNGAIANEAYEDCDVTITDGKVLPKAGRQNNGSPADSIVFYVSFSDDPYPAAYGYAKYKVSGIRYSGLAEND